MDPRSRLPAWVFALERRRRRAPDRGRARVTGWEYDDGHYAKWGITSEISFVTLASTRLEKVRAAVRVRKYAIAWQEHVAELVCAPNGSGRRADLAAFVADFDAV